MKKKTIFGIISVVLLLGFILMPFNTCALAYTGGTTTITANGSYNLLDYLSTTKLIINAGLTVTLVGYDIPPSPKEPEIICNGNNTLTLDNVDILSTSAGICPLTFNGKGNTLIVRNYVEFEGGAGTAGISVGHNVELEIKGDGTLFCDGTDGGAGIGGNAGSDSGSITISGTSMVVYGEGDDGGSGIGGGSGGSNGTVLITGGEIMAVADSGSAGIGGGMGGAAGTITISGGKVFAATKGASDDIGPGNTATGGTITFSGSAAVFLMNDKVYNPILVDPIEHVSPVTFSGTSFRGIPLSAYFLMATGVYLPKIATPIAGIPATGEDITNLYWFIGLGVAAIAGIALLLRNKNKVRI